MLFKRKSIVSHLFFSFVFLAAAGVLATSAPASGLVRIVLQDKASVDARDVVLGQIARIECEDPQMRQKLLDLPVASVAAPGQSALIRLEQVDLRLKQLGLKADQYNLSASGPVTITRRFSEVSEERIAAAVRAFIQNRAPWKHDQMKIRYIDARQSLQVPPGSVSFQITPPRHTDWLGAVPFYVTVKVDGQSIRRLHVATYIEVWNDVVLSAKPLGRGQPIGEADIQVRKMDLARVPVNAVLDSRQVIGRRTNRAIAANSIFRNDMVEIPPLVRKGDLVQVVAESDMLRITTRGIARENGGKGERIRVKNLRSKKTIYAQVVDANLVRVDF